MSNKKKDSNKADIINLVTALINLTITVINLIIALRGRQNKGSESSPLIAQQHEDINRYIIMHRNPSVDNKHLHFGEEHPQQIKGG